MKYIIFKYVNSKKHYVMACSSKLEYTDKKEYAKKFSRLEALNKIDVLVYENKIKHYINSI